MSDNKAGTLIDPTPIMQISNGYWTSMVLHAATKFSIFTVLDGKSLSLEETVSAIKKPKRGIEMLMNACCALGFLDKKSGLYSNTPLAEEYLVENKVHYLGYMVFLMDRLYANWGKLVEVIESNSPVEDRFDEDFSVLDEDARDFTLAMHGNSSLTAPVLAGLVDLSENKKLLDIGGGSGINSIVLAEKNPQLEATVFDFPSVLKVAEGFISRSSATDRIMTMAGDFNTDPLPTGFDCILLSHILHGEGKEGAKILLKNCFNSLESSGQIIILEFLLNEEKDGPVFPALFAINMLIETENGDAFTAGELKILLEECGFTFERSSPLSDHSPVSIVVAVKP